MSNSAWCDLSSNGNMLKLPDRCPIAKCNCQKIITFTPHQYMLEDKGFKSTMKKIFRGSQTAWNNFLKPAVNVAAPSIGVAVSAKKKNLKIGAATTNILKSISGRSVLKLTDLHGNALRIKVM